MADAVHLISAYQSACRVGVVVNPAQGYYKVICWLPQNDRSDVIVQWFFSRPTWSARVDQCLV